METGACPGIRKRGGPKSESLFFFFFFAFQFFRGGGPAQKLAEKMIFSTKKVAKYRWNSLIFVLMTFFFAFQFLGGGGAWAPPPGHAPGKGFWDVCSDCWTILICWMCNLMLGNYLINSSWTIQLKKKFEKVLRYSVLWRRTVSYSALQGLSLASRFGEVS